MSSLPEIDDRMAALHETIAEIRPWSLPDGSGKDVTRDVYAVLAAMRDAIADLEDQRAGEEAIYAPTG